MMYPSTEHTFSCPYMCCTYILIMCFRPSDFLATLARDDGFHLCFSTLMLPKPEEQAFSVS
jgi:hypothetical protein